MKRFAEVGRWKLEIHSEVSHGRRYVASREITGVNRVDLPILGESLPPFFSSQRRYRTEIKLQRDILGNAFPKFSWGFSEFDSAWSRMERLKVVSCLLVSLF